MGFDAHLQGFKVSGIVMNQRKLARIGGLAASAFSAYFTVLHHGLIADLAKAMDAPEGQLANASG